MSKRRVHITATVHDWIDVDCESDEEAAEQAVGEFIEGAGPDWDDIHTEVQTAPYQDRNDD